MLLAPLPFLAFLGIRIQDAAEQFTGDFNREVLLPAGMYCKTQRGVFRNGKYVQSSFAQSYLIVE